MLKQNRNATVVSSAGVGSKILVFILKSLIHFLGPSIPYFWIKTPTRADNWSKRNGGLSGCIRCSDQFPRLRGTVVLPPGGKIRILWPQKCFIQKHGKLGSKNMLQILIFVPICLIKTITIFLYIFMIGSRVSVGPEFCHQVARSWSAPLPPPKPRCSSAACPYSQ